ncbi:MAG: hypothetical protein IKC77_03345 [Lentisphaeria bacterium]|nr:hypothetical protein [Lentisphaeria bacterium]
MENSDFCSMPVWYPALAEWTFPTSFIRLRDEAVTYLASSDEEREKADRSFIPEIISELGKVMSRMSGAQVVSVDTCSPTDTERFESKRGAVHSPESAWRFLTLSEKVRQAAADGKVKHICVRPYRNMTLAREFRLFVFDGKLAAMSQYNLIRHYYRLDGVKDAYLALAEKFVESIAWKIPAGRVVIDIYITGSNKIMVVDLNPWGEPTSPLLLRKWERDWSVPAGIVLMEIPCKISGNVNVSF